MNFETYDLITNISALSSLIPLIAFAIAMTRKKQPTSVKLVGLLLATATTAELATFILYEAYRINPNPFVNLYLIFQFILTALAYRSVYTKRLTKMVANLSIVLFTIFATVNMCYMEGIKNMNSNLFTISAVALITHSFLYSYQILKDLSEPFIERIFMFWFSAGIFLYFGTNLFLFATVDRLIQAGNEQFMLSWGMHNGTNVVKNIFFTVAMYTTVLSPKKPSGETNEIL